MIDIEATWDFSDPTVSEDRFRAALSEETNLDIRDELKTQIARTYSLRRRFEEAHAQLNEVQHSNHPRVKARYLLERGRTFNSSQQQETAKPLFEQAYKTANDAGEEFLAADAAHMVAIAAKGDEAIAWNLRTVETAERAKDPKAKKWTGAARNNLGWAYHDLGRFPEALEQFEAAEEFYRAGPLNYRLIAKWTIGRTLRSMGRLEEALQKQQDLEAERQEPSGFVSEEIAECLLALKRQEESRPHFARAYELLCQDQWLTAEEPERINRLKELGAAP